MDILGVGHYDPGHRPSHHNWEKFLKYAKEDHMVRVNLVEFAENACGGALVAYNLGLLGTSVVGLVRSQDKVKEKLWSLPKISPEHRMEYWKYTPQ